MFVVIGESNECVMVIEASLMHASNCPGSTAFKSTTRTLTTRQLDRLAIARTETNTMAAVRLLGVRFGRRNRMIAGQ